MKKTICYVWIPFDLTLEYAAKIDAKIHKKIAAGYEIYEIISQLQHELKPNEFGFACFRLGMINSVNIAMEGGLTQLIETIRLFNLLAESLSEDELTVFITRENKRSMKALEKSRNNPEIS